MLLFTPFGCSSNSIQPILSRLRREAGYYGKCYFIGRTPCSKVHDAAESFILNPVTYTIPPICPASTQICADSVQNSSNPTFNYRRYFPWTALCWLFPLFSLLSYIWQSEGWYADSFFGLPLMYSSFQILIDFSISHSINDSNLKANYLAQKNTLLLFCSLAG